MLASSLMTLLLQKLDQHLAQQLDCIQVEVAETLQETQPWRLGHVFSQVCSTLLEEMPLKKMPVLTLGQPHGEDKKGMDYHHSSQEHYIKDHTIVFDYAK